MEDGSWKEGEKSAILFVEISEWGKNLQPLIDFFQKRKLILNLTFERAISNTELNRISYLWSQFFLNWWEPLAILQHFQPIRTNHSFKKSFSKSASFFKEKKLSGWHKIRGKNYQLHYYPISLFKKFEKAGILYCQDMTRHFHLKEQLFQSEKMLSLCKLGKNMAHQLNNPLTGLRSMTQILQQIPEMKDFEEELMEMEKATDRSQKIIKNLLSFSKIEGGGKSCSLNQAVKGCLPLLKNRTRGILIQLEASKEPLEIKGELAVLQQIAYNLILNSCQALKEGDQEEKKPVIKIETKKISNNRACLKVKDNGPGIEKQNLEKFSRLFGQAKNQNREPV